MSHTLNKELEFYKGIGPNKAKLILADLGVKTAGDLLFRFPFRYVDKTVFTTISQAEPNKEAQIIGKLISKEMVSGRRQQRLSATLKDSSGLIELLWFQGAKWIEPKLQLGAEYKVYGKLSKYKGSKTISHPEMELTKGSKSAEASLEPVYASTERLNKIGFSSKKRREILISVLRSLAEKDIPENLPQYLREKLGLISKYQALKWIHFPLSQEHLEQARKRLKFEEALFFQLRFQYNKNYRKLKYKGLPFPTVGDAFTKYYKEKIPFELTGAQKRVVKEIRADLGSGSQMNRLLQGDVGSGKTMVALLSILLAKDNGFQSTLLAPTEILALQHFKSITENLSGLGIRTAFLSGSIKGKKRASLLKFLESGELDILIGTHAILEDPVVFQKLGIAIVDEQHRFGVMQRARLWAKNKECPPHILVMTATPIPRTLAMTIYGDLDVSVIDELPPGRKQIKTIHKREKNRPQVIEFMHEQIRNKKQIYVVYPLIEESAKLDLSDLNRGYEELLVYFPPPDYKISIVHGRMRPEDKEAEMKKFVKGHTHIMVATTVIEVGVNVPNATVMVIENTERFGLSQLHQLRGRVGRGGDQSYCILMSSSKLSENARKRIKIMVDTTDGFRIAEEDLKLRGPGDIEGTQQSGVQDFKIFDLSKDDNILYTASKVASTILENDSFLEHQDNKPLLDQLDRLNRGFKDWGRIS